MKKILLLLMVMVLVIAMFAGCMTGGAEQNIAQQQNQLVQQANSAVGMPNIKNFYMKRLAKDIQELCDQSDLVCYAYTKVEMTGKFVYLGRCMGYGLPYSVQYTNPETVQRLKPTLADGTLGYGDDYIVPQADPNGLYMPDGLAATWVVMINEETGERSIMYFESDLIVSQTKLPARICEDWSLPAGY